MAMMFCCSSGLFAFSRLLPLLSCSLSLPLSLFPLFISLPLSPHLVLLLHLHINRHADLLLAPLLMMTMVGIWFGLLLTSLLSTHLSLPALQFSSSLSSSPSQLCSSLHSHLPSPAKTPSCCFCRCHSQASFFSHSGNFLFVLTTTSLGPFRHML